MKLAIPVVIAAAALCAAPLAATANQDPNTLKRGELITVRGCVEQGAKKGHYVLANFSQIPPAGEAAIPKTWQGRRVLFWLEDLPKMDQHFNHMVEVQGEFINLRESELDPKVQDGGQIVELEGPGRDVDVTMKQAREVVGTSGMEKTQTLLIRVDVDEVKMISDKCN